MVARAADALKRPARTNPALRELLEQLEGGLHFDGADALLPYLYDTTVTLGDYAGRETMTCLIEPRSLFDDATHAALSRDLSERKMEKHYYAVVAGVMKAPDGVIDAPIGRSHSDRKKMAVTPDGRPSRTEWRVVRQDGDRALLDIHLITGRTHQIRVHMSSIHHPVLGDPIYGHKSMPKAPRLMLHAYSLSFTHPATGERMTFTAPPEPCFGLDA